jgi:hypothetical protein
VLTYPDIPSLNNLISIIDIPLNLAKKTTVIKYNVLDTDKLCPYIK